MYVYLSEWLCILRTVYVRIHTYVHTSNLSLILPGQQLVLQVLRVTLKPRQFLPPQ